MADISNPTAPVLGRRGALFGVPLAAASLAVGAARADTTAPSVTVETADVVVIGAGLSGLTAARRLHEAGKTVLVLECRDRVGGRNYTAPIGGHRLELGGQFIGPTQTAARALIAELGLKLRTVFTDAKRIWELADRSLEFGNERPPLPWGSLLDLPHIMSKIDALAAEVGATTPWLHPRAAALDGITVAQWMADNAYTQTAVDLMTCSVRAVFGADPGEISMLFLLNYTAQGDTIEMLTNTKDGAQDAVIIGGSQQMSLKLAASLGDRVRVNDAVVHVLHEENAVLVTTQSGRQYRAAKLVIAMPPGSANRIDHVPPLPEQRRDLQNRAPMGRYYKVIATYDRPIWRERGFSGEVASVRGPIIASYDDEPADGGAAILGFIGGDAASAWAAQDETARRESALQCLARWFGPEMLKPTGFGYHDWCADWRQGGAPVTVLPPGVLSRAGRALRTPCGHVHWAGTEAAVQWSGYMDGAIRAGDAVAAEILAKL